MPLLCAAGVGAVAADTVSDVGASHDKGVYFLDLDVEVKARADRVHELIGDIEGLYRLSSAIEESTRLESGITGVARRRLLLRTCLLFYCFHAELVEDLHYVGTDTIIAEVVPGLGQFSSGHTQWQVSATGADSTRIRLRSTLKPAFWVPPVIGPWVMKRRLVSAATETARRIEQLAVDG